MARTFTALFAAVTILLTTLAPSTASARDYYRGHHGHHYRDHDDDDGDAIAAGVIGLVLGLAVGAAASQPRAPRYSGPTCYSNCYRPGPTYAPSHYGYGGYGSNYYAPPPQPYYQPSYQDYGLDGGYYDPRYASGGYAAPSCTRRERQWDRYANRYVVVDVPC